MKLKSILITSEFFSPMGGGIEQYLLGLSQWLVMEGYRVYVLTSKWDDALPVTDSIGGVSVFYSELLNGSLEDPFSVLKNKYAIASFFKSKKIDIIYANNHNSLAVIQAANSVNIPVIYGCHGVGLICPLKKKFLKDNDELCWNESGIKNCTKCFFQQYEISKKPLKSFLHLFISIWPKVLKYRRGESILRSADGRIGNSNLCAELIRKYGDSVGLPLPVDLSENGYCPVNSREICKKFNLEYKNFVLVPGRLNRTKGQKYVVEAMKMFPGKKFVFAGNSNLLFGDSDNIGEYGESIKKEILEHNLQSQAVFTGFLSFSEMRALYSCARVTVVPSIWIETFGYVVVESLACETPVIATANTGASQCISDRWGRIIERKRPDLIAKALSEIWEEAIPMGRLGREYLVKSHNWQIIGEKTLKYFNKTIESHRLR